MGLLLAGAGILIAMLFVQALDHIAGRRQAARRSELLSPVGVAASGLVVAGLSCEALGWLVTGGPVWAGLFVAGLGVLVAGGQWLVSRLVGPDATGEQGGA